MPTINAQTLLNDYPCLQCVPPGQERQIIRAGLLYGIAGNLGVSVDVLEVPPAFAGLQIPELQAIQSAILCELLVASGESECTPQGVLTDNPCLQCLDETSSELILLSALKTLFSDLTGTDPTDSEWLETMSGLYGMSEQDMEAVVTGIYCALLNFVTGHSCDLADAWTDSDWYCPCWISADIFGLQAAMWPSVVFSSEGSGKGLTDEEGNVLTDESGNELVFVL